MSFRAQGPGPGFVLARLLLASVFIVIGAWRLWAAYGGLQAARLATLWWRQRGDRWMVLGVR